MRNRTVCFTHRLQAVQAPQGFKGCGELTAADLAMEPARSRSPGNAADQGVCMGVGVCVWVWVWVGEGGVGGSEGGGVGGQ